MPRPSGACDRPKGTSVWAFHPVTSRPASVMRPAFGLSSPDTARSVLVLPAPLAPMRATTSPWPTDSDNPFRA